MTETDLIYRAICHEVIQTEQPFIVIDGSKLPNSDWYILRASVVSAGRAITLYEHIYERSEQFSVRLYRYFLNKLKHVLPETCHPILVTDVEFRLSWFTLVRKLGWDFIGRLRGHSNISTDEDLQPDDWHDVWGKATKKPKYLGEGYYCRQKEFPGFFYLYKKPGQGRHAHTRTGRPSRTQKSNRHKASVIEPWLLISSLEAPAKYIVGAYQLRMSIE